MLHIMLDKAAIAGLGRSGSMVLFINGVQLTNAGMSITDEQYLRMPKEEKEQLDAAVDKGLVNITSDSATLSDTGEVEDLARSFPSVNVTKLGFNFTIKAYSEDITIAVGDGSLGVDSVANLVKANSYLVGAIVKVLTAPGGGATTLDAGRKTIAVDEIVDGIAVAANTTVNSWEHATPLGFAPNAVNDKITLTTDFDVTISDMVVRVITFVAEIV